MDLHRWDARVERPSGLVVPVHIDPGAVTGPTRHQAAGPRWRQTSPGRYVPAATPADVVEQRILEQATRLRSWGAATGWAALRWRGARFFEGVDATGQLVPVPLVTGGVALNPDPRVTISRTQLAPEEREYVDGVWVTSPERALFDEVRRHGELRQGVVDVEMAFAAGLLTLDELAAYVARRNAWEGVAAVRAVLAAAGLGCRTPQEVRMVLVWMWDAGLPRPLCNVPVFDLSGNLIAIPDLLDVAAGLVGEYQGADHKDGARHRADVAREQALRNHGLECFEVVGGDLADRPMVVRRMLAARTRAAFHLPEQRTWTLRQPAWWPAWAAARGL